MGFRVLVHSAQCTDTRASLLSSFVIDAGGDLGHDLGFWQITRCRVDLHPADAVLVLPTDRR